MESADGDVPPSARLRWPGRPPVPATPPGLELLARLEAVCARPRGQKHAPKASQPAEQSQKGKKNGLFSLLQEFIHAESTADWVNDSLLRPARLAYSVEDLDAPVFA